MRDDQRQPVLVGRNRQKLSPWVTLTERLIEFPGKSQPEAYHALAQADYVSGFVVTEDGRIPLVEQYRPAVEKVTVELPGGINDTGSTPEQTIIRELAEETGLSVVEPPKLLGNLAPDTGRLENRFWGYFIKAGPQVPGWEAEEFVKTRFVTQAELRSLIDSGEFEHALHLALIGLAVMRGLYTWS